ERAASDPGHTQLQSTDAGLHLPVTIAVAIPRSFVRALKGRRFDVLTHLGLKHLVEHAFQQLAHALISTKKLMQHLAIYGNLVLGHPLHPPVGFVFSTQPLPGGGWPFLLLGHPGSRIYTIIPDTTP